jgi:hypothetical protein
MLNPTSVHKREGSDLSDDGREPGKMKSTSMEMKTQIENQPRGATRYKKMRSCGSQKSVWEKPDLTGCK